MDRPQDITSLERFNRVNEVKTLMLQGCSTSQIAKYCEDKYNLGQTALYDYIKQAKQLMIDDFHKTTDFEAFKAEIYSRLEDLYQKSMDIDDFKECRNILKDIREMLGVNAPTKTDLTTNGKEIQSTPFQVEIVKPIDDI
jgi:predicted DNA-binding protein YlxM (UPF0122 family)